MITYDPKNWIRILLDFPRSPVFRTLFFDVLGAGLYAAGVVWAENKAQVAVPLGPSFLSILGIILGLLLVFRTNTAYDRWWEGRKLWGQLVNVSRALSHSLDAMLPADGDARARYVALLSAFPGALAVHLRAPRDPNAPHRPNEIVRGLVTTVHRDVREARLPREAIIALTPMLAAFDTPIPFSYSSYIKQFVVLYALVVPFGLAREFGYGTVIAAMFTFFATMGLELLATEIEEPFGGDRNDLPLDDLAERIARDVRALLAPAPAA
jgi:ion channel-forming bestrophin family protein